MMVERLCCANLEKSKTFSVKRHLLYSLISFFQSFFVYILLLVDMKPFISNRETIYAIRSKDKEFFR